MQKATITIEIEGEDIPERGRTNDALSGCLEQVRETIANAVFEATEDNGTDEMDFSVQVWLQPVAKPVRHVRVYHDHDPENPADDEGQWKPISFSTRHRNYEHPAYYLTNEEVKAKLEEGLAFWLSYYEHGQCLWYLQGHAPPGADCPWDSVDRAGILIWDHPTSEMGWTAPEDRQKDAEAFLRRYTGYCNGTVYGFEVVDENGEHIDSCGGFYTIEDLVEAVRETVPDFTVSDIGEVEF